MKNPITSFILLCTLLGLSVAACRRAPSPNQNIPARKSSSGAKLQGKDLDLRSGMKIKLAQPQMAFEGKILPPEEAGQWYRELKVDNPSGAEGLSFEWNLSKTEAPAAESLPSAAGGSPAASGKMTLANTVTSRRMTLPIFWPPGELFLSNSGAVWLSDQSFAELKKQGKTQWDLGVLDNPLLGPVQGVDLLEASLEATSRGLAAKNDPKTSTQEIEVTDKSADFPLKLNGASTTVEVIEAGNALANYKILNNPQNPLILEVEVAPRRSAANELFLPLSWVRGLLNYRVVEVDLP